MSEKYVTNVGKHLQMKLTLIFIQYMSTQKCHNGIACNVRFRQIVKTTSRII